VVRESSTGDARCAVRWHLGEKGEIGADADGLAGAGGRFGDTTIAIASASATPRRLASSIKDQASIPQRTQRRLQDGQQHVNPLMGQSKAHPEQPPCTANAPLEGRGFQEDQDKQWPILRHRQWTVLVGCVPLGDAMLSCW
jgi:hypothetical protein